MARTSEPVAWLSLVDVSGPFLVGAVLERAFPQGLEKIETPRRQRLRAAYDEWQDAVEELDPQLPALHDAWVRMVLEDSLEYDSESLATKARLAGSILYRPQEHAIEYAPDFAVRAGDGAPRLLIAIYPPKTNLENPLPQETWLATPVERMVLLCRTNQCRVGLVTNGEQWMLVNAPVGETSGYASWYARYWWQEPVTLKAFQSLLGVRRCFGPEEDTLSRLLERSLHFQEEVTNTLGEQVRRAVEMLIQALGRADQDRNGELLKDIAPAELYEAGLTVMMRLVFLLSAEERGLLLLGDPLYDQHYAISTLRGNLHEDADQHGVEVLERRHDAWSRLLATFRGIFAGIEHEALRLPALGGSLFDPDRFPFLEGRATKTKWHEQPAIPLPIDNRTVLLLMTALQILEQKGGAQLLSYRALDVEQIGHVYEGLLEFTAARVPEITLGLIGTKKIPNPQITLSELDSIAAKGEDALLEHLTELTGRSLAALGKALKAEESREMLVRLVQASNGDEALARRLLPFGELIRADSWGNLFVYRQGSFAIVKGTDRRSSGTHYTPRSLTEPIVHYTLEPLVYLGPAEGHPQSEWKLKSSADILALNVCDMACGSGAFLVEACRYLSLRLVEAWAIEEARDLQIAIDGIARETLGEHEPMPTPLDDRLLVARRLVAQSCLYGVDINHLAVELAKLAIWLVTLAKNKPFNFLDHALRCGDSLVGLHDLEQLRFFSLKPDAENPVLFKGPLNTAVDEAIDLRLKLEGKPADTVADVEAQRLLLAEAEDDVARLKCSADLLVAAEFWGENNADKLERTRNAAARSAYYVDKGPTEEFQHVAAMERRAQKMFHWPLEFPEVIVKRGGFDAFVGNPPFKGGKYLRGLLGDAYAEFLRIINPHVKGSPDLVAYFVLRAVALARPGGSIGEICTKSIFQGETRESSLDFLYDEDQATERRRIENQKWPGTAAVHIAIVWMQRSPSTTAAGALRPSTNQFTKPYRLSANVNTCFQGTNIVNSGFIVDPAWCHDLIGKSSTYSDVLFPLIEGAALNATPNASWRRWIIDFHDWSEDKASHYQACFDLVAQRVKPQRMTSNRERYRRFWWQFGERQQGLYDRAISLDQVIVIAYTSNTLAFTFVPSRNVVFYNTSVICTESFSHFATLQSSFHAEWIREYGSSLKGDARYAPERCFEPFPFCKDSSSLSRAGHNMYEFRKATMLKAGEGLTKTYNRFHDSDETSTDIQKLRELQVEMDNAVIATYDWTDINLDHDFHETKQGFRFTIGEAARREVLKRLLKLNHERYVEETTKGLHGKKSRSTNRRRMATTDQIPLIEMEND
jgi:hypothetical protein